MEARLIAELPKNRRETLRVVLDRYKGHDLVSVRVWAADPERGAIPTRAGLAVRLSLLPDLVVALQQAERQARQEGLLGRDGGVDG